MMGFIRIFVQTFVDVVSWLLIIYCVLSWIVPPYNELRSRLENLMGMFLNPIRSFLPPIGGMDLSPIVLMLILQFIESILLSVFH